MELDINEIVYNENENEEITEPKEIKDITESSETTVEEEKEETSETVEVKPEAETVVEEEKVETPVTEEVKPEEEKKIEEAGEKTKEEKPAQDKKESKEEKPKKETKKKEDVKPSVDTSNIISLYDYIQKYNSKLLNCSNVNLTFNDVAVGKYLLFKTNVAQGELSELIFFEDCNCLYMDEFEPDSISVQNSGIIISSETKKAYVSKMNIISCDIKDGFPTKMYKYKRCVKEIENIQCEVTEAEKKYNDLDSIKLKIKGICPRLYSVINETDDKALIKKEIATFVENVVDINYLVKINKELLMTIDL